MSLEAKDILHLRRQTFEANHLGNALDPSHAILVAADLNDQMQRRDHLLANRAAG